MSNRIEQLRKLLETEPYDSFLNYALALEHAKANEIQRAILLLEKIIERDKNYLGAYYQLGKYYEQEQQVPLAIQTYKQGIEISIQQNNRKTQMELSEALLQLEDD